MEEEFRAALLASSGVIALVGDRIDFGGNPQARPIRALPFGRSGIARSSRLTALMVFRKGGFRSIATPRHMAKQNYFPAQCGP